MTVEELGYRMSSAEFTEWMAYAELEPFGPRREDRRAGEVVATLANIHRDHEKQPTPWDWTDVFPEWTPPETAEQARARRMAQLTNFGAYVKSLPKRLRK